MPDLRPLAALIFALVVGANSNAYAETISAGGTNVWLDAPASPKASLVLAPGKGGMSDSDPLQRARAKYVEQGFAVLSVDSDTNIQAAMKQMAKVAKPVYLAAVSQGVSKVGAILARGKFRMRGLVLVSGNLELVREKTNNPENLPRTLVIHHRDDGCSNTPASEVEKFKAWGGKMVTVVWLDGGTDRGDACGPNSHHGLAGLDDQVVAAISNFLR